MIRLLLLLAGAAGVIWLSGSGPALRAALEGEAEPARVLSALERGVREAGAVVADAVAEASLLDAAADLAPPPAPDRVEALADPVEAPDPVEARELEPREAPAARAWAEAPRFGAPSSESAAQSERPAERTSVPLWPSAAPVPDTARGLSVEGASAVVERLDRVMDLAAGRRR